MKLVRRLNLGLFGNSRNIKYYTLNGILFTMVTIFAKSFAAKFLDRLGGAPIHYSLLNALPGFVAIFVTIPGIVMIQRSKNKRRIMEGFFYLSRSFPLLLAVVPFLPETSRPLAFVLIYGLMNFPESISATALQSFTGDVFSPKERAEAITYRNSYSQIAQLVTSIIMGVVLSVTTTNSSAVFMYQFFIVLSFLLGIREVHYLKMLKTVEVKSAPVIRPMDSIRRVLQHKDYRSFLICSLIFHFGWQTGWPLFSIYQISYLGADEKWLTIVNVVLSLSGIVSFPIWQRIVKKTGYDLGIVFATICMASTPILYTFTRTMFENASVQPIIGFSTAGITAVLLGLMLESSPEGESLISAAIHTTLTSVTLAVAPLFGNLVLSLFGLTASLYVSGTLRAVGSLAFLIRYRMKNRKDVSIN
ncbi:MFS transporter [Youngiibacter multivorans]|uniref:MFS family arabinose efflux permease n=1 Tax=Youngiibacter multivorans TaxID=937251 RepID=A0ABS4G3R7_9CLOT|nr:MFS transporter [Youngiibacter multivorans]MBP1919181.1 putative MFS family arabinose efflux permease [Youngiibacter multivorans]